MPAPATTDPRRLLVGISLGQLGCGVAGLVLAQRRGHAYDLPIARGAPEAVARDAILIGTALSAPVTMLAAQAVLTGVLAAHPSSGAARALSILGGAMVAGYLAERHVRDLARPDHWDALETPVAALGLGLAAAMGAVGRRAGRAMSVTARD